MTNEGESSNVENDEMVAATLEQSTTIQRDDTQVNSEIDSTTPKETISDESEQIMADSQASSTKQVVFFVEINQTNDLFCILSCIVG